MINLKYKLFRKSITFGSWVTIGHPAIAEIMANCGFEWLTVDMEHSSITLPQAEQLIRVIELSGVVPLVRVGYNDSALIKRVMDAGAHGVIVPMVNSREDAIKAVNAAKYPPQGTRGVGLARAQGYGLRFGKYKEWLKENCIVIAQIEHIKAIDNLEDILTTPGIDGTIIGPYDLSGSLGFPGDFDRQEVKDALIKYENTCAELKKPKGFHVVQPSAELTKAYLEKDYSFVAIGLDTLYLANKCQETLKGLI